MNKEIFSVERYKGNQYGIYSSNGNWIVFGKKKALEQKAKELNRLEIDKQPIDWDKE